MKLGLISDVHGDPVALELAWAHLTVLGADRILCAGDVVGYGPFPDRAVAFLREHEIASVRGNHDRWALGRGLGAPDEFGGGLPSADTLEFLASLPPNLVAAAGTRVAVVVHGSPSSDMEFVSPRSHPVPVLEALLEQLGTDLLVMGHTHRPAWYRCARGLVVNPGSVISMPRVETSRTFAIVESETLAVTFHDVDTGAAVEVASWPAQASRQPGADGVS